MRRLAATVAIGLLAGCGLTEPSDFYLYCLNPDQNTFPPLKDYFQLRPAEGRLLALQPDDSFRDMCPEEAKCGKVVISDGLITQSMTFPVVTANVVRSQEFWFNRLTGDMRLTSRFDNGDVVWTAICERHEEPPEPKTPKI
jgi:hypothetical protein